MHSPITDFSDAWITDFGATGEPPAGEMGEPLGDQISRMPHSLARRSASVRLRTSSFP